MRPFLGDTFADDEFRAADRHGLCRASTTPRARRWCSLAPNHFLLELFHGPTLAFKDFAMQLIGQMLQAALAKSGERITIVGATSRRHRVGGDRGVPRAGECRCVHPVPAWPGVARCSAGR